MYEKIFFTTIEFFIKGTYTDVNKDKNDDMQNPTI